MTNLAKHAKRILVYAITITLLQRSPSRSRGSKAATVMVLRQS